MSAVATERALEPERSERPYLILRERSEGEAQWSLILPEGATRGQFEVSAPEAAA
jgi:hypothetical protein